VQAVSVTWDATIQDVSRTEWTDFSAYTGGSRTARAYFETTNSGNLYWDYTVSCGNGTRTQHVQGAQKISCPGP